MPPRYAILPRFSPRALTWIYDQESDKRALFRGTDPGRIVSITEEYHLDDLEVNDLQGDGLNAVVTDRFKAAAEPFISGHVTIAPCVVSNHQIDRQLFIMAGIAKVSGAVDHDASRLYYTDDISEIRNVYKLILKETDDEGEPIETPHLFRIAEFPDLMIVSAELAQALCAAELSGIRLLPLETWFTGADNYDGYLSPDGGEAELATTNDLIISDPPIDTRTFNPEKRFL